jgi:hypothetical protein
MPKEIFIKYDTNGKLIQSYKMMFIAANFIEYIIKLKNYETSILDEDIPQYLIINKNIKMINSKSNLECDIPAESFFRIAREL